MLDRKAEDRKAEDRKAEDRKAVERKAVERKVLERKVLERKAVDTNHSTEYVLVPWRAGQACPTAVRPTRRGVKRVEV